MSTQSWPNYHSIIAMKEMSQADLGSRKLRLTERQIISFRGFM